MGYLEEYTKLGYFTTNRNIQMTNKSWDGDREKLRELLKELRKNEAGLTQVELSQALGKPQSYVSKYETGERKLDYVEINDICKILGIPMARFNNLYEKRIQEK
jgi:transcriptional regulator with XRE-family HTH domain